MSYASSPLCSSDLSRAHRYQRGRSRTFSSVGSRRLDGLGPDCGRLTRAPGV